MAKRRRNDSSLNDLMELQEKLASFEILQLATKLDSLEALHDQTADPKLKKLYVKEAKAIRKRLEKLGDKLLRLQGEPPVSVDRMQ